MSKVVEVKLWGTTIGYLGYPDESNIAQFEYDEEFVKLGVQPSPLLMKHPPMIHSFEDISFRTFKGVPGIFADSLPDKFGNQLIDLFMADKKIAQKDITTLDRLLYVGKRGMGAIEYHPSTFEDDLDQYKGALDINLLSELADMVVTKKDQFHKKLHDSKTKKEALELIRIGSSAGGARAKALVAKKNNQFYDGTLLYNSNEYTYWLIKFDSASNQDRDAKDPIGMTRVEYIYSIFARELDITIPRTDYIECGEDFHFLIERFDRVVQNEKTTKLHYISWAGLSHFDRDTTGAYSYEQLVMNLRELKFGQDAITEIFKRAVFNIVGRNQDDHTKNFGLIMDRNGQWRLSPAFDMTYSYDPTGKWTKDHQIRLNKKQNNFTREDIISFGKYCNLKEKQSLEILKNTIAVFRRFNALAKKYNVPIELKQTILENLRTSL